MVDIARFDVIHTTVYQHALSDIQVIGTYCHGMVLDSAGFDVRSVNINWAHIRDAVAQTMDAELMALAMLFFAPKLAKSHGYSVATHPEKFVAIGHAKQTFGYGMLTALPAPLVEFWTRQTGAQAKGSLQKHKNVYDTALNGGKLAGSLTPSTQQIARDYMPPSPDDEVDIFG